MLRSRTEAESAMQQRDNIESYAIHQGADPPCPVTKVFFCGVLPGLLATSPGSNYRSNQSPSPGDRRRSCRINEEVFAFYPCQRNPTSGWIVQRNFCLSRFNAAFATRTQEERSRKRRGQETLGTCSFTNQISEKSSVSAEPSLRNFPFFLLRVSGFQKRSRVVSDKEEHENRLGDRCGLKGSVRFMEVSKKVQEFLETIF